MLTATSTIDTDVLARHAANGDHDALDALLEQIRPEVLRRCRRLLASRLDAEDTCQDVLFTISRRIGSFEGRARFSTWLYPVIAHAVTDSYRRLRHRTSLLADDAGIASAEHVSQLAGTRLDLLEALDQLAPAFATPVLLRDGWGFGYREVAMLLDLPEGTVKSRVHEGRRRLRHALTN